MELQLHLKSLHHAPKEQHALYDELRSIDATAKQEQRELTPQEAERKAELITASRAINDDAYEAALAEDQQTSMRFN